VKGAEGTEMVRQEEKVFTTEGTEFAEKREENGK
jgi:hypothetical protein